MAGLYGELVIDREKDTINGKPWPILKPVFEPNRRPLKFWELSETHIAEVSKFPIVWYLELIKQTVAQLDAAEPSWLAALAVQLESQVQDLHIRVMDDLTKNAPGRKPMSAATGTGSSSPANPNRPR